MGAPRPDLNMYHTLYYLIKMNTVFLILFKERSCPVRLQAYIEQKGIELPCCDSAQCSRPHQKLFFMNTTSIDKKFRHSPKKLPGSWKIYFFYFKHCVLTISKWHLPTCRAEIGEFHSIKCLFLTPIFFMITLFHTMVISNFFLRNLLNFLKI